MSWDNVVAARAWRWWKQCDFQDRNFINQQCRKPKIVPQRGRYTVITYRTYTVKLKFLVKNSFILPKTSTAWEVILRDWNKRKSSSTSFSFTYRPIVISCFFPCYLFAKPVVSKVYPGFETFQSMSTIHRLPWYQIKHPRTPENHWTSVRES